MGDACIDCLEAGDGAGLFQPIDGCDVGMIQKSENMGLPLETSQALAVVGELLGQGLLDADSTLQLRVDRAVDLAHAARQSSAPCPARPASGSEATKRGSRCGFPLLGSETQQEDTERIPVFLL